MDEYNKGLLTKVKNLNHINMELQGQLQKKCHESVIHEQSIAKITEQKKQVIGYLETKLVKSKEETKYIREKETENLRDKKELLEKNKKLDQTVKTVEGTIQQLKDVMRVELSRFKQEWLRKEKSGVLTCLPKRISKSNAENILAELLNIVSNRK